MTAKKMRCANDELPAQGCEAALPQVPDLKQAREYRTTTGSFAALYCAETLQNH
jgi:hypothetical protein